MESTLRSLLLCVFISSLHHFEQLAHSIPCPGEWRYLRLFTLSQQNQNPDWAETSNAKNECLIFLRSIFLPLQS